MTYTLKCDEPFYVVTEYNSDLERKEREVKSRDGLMDIPSFYWIESEDREDVLKCGTFSEGERALIDLKEEETSFEDIVENNDYPDFVEIKEHRPPY